MGREDREARPLGQRLGRRAREGRALLGVRAGHELVAQHERRPARLPQDLGDVRQVTRERREIAGDRLLIADVRQHGREEADAAALVRGHEQARARQQRRQRDGLEQHGLAARVGPAHDEQARRHGPAERDVVGDQRKPLARGAQREEGVARAAQIDERLVDDGHGDAPIRHAEPGRGREDVQLDEGHGRRAQRGRRLGDARRELLEDAARLGADLELGHLEAVVGGDERHGLDVHRLARARRVVHDAEAHRLRARLDGQHVALFADRDVAILQHGRELRPAHERLDRGARPVGELRALAPQARQRGRHGVADLARRVERLVEGPRQRGLRVDARGARVELGRGQPPARRALIDEAAHARSHGAQVGDGPDLLGTEHEPLLGGVQDLAGLGDVQRGQRLAPTQDRGQLVDGRQVTPRLVDVVVQRQRQAGGAPRV